MPGARDRPGKRPSVTESTPAVDVLTPGAPSFAAPSTVAWDELDMLGVLHHSRFAVHVERAFGQLLAAMGFPYDPDPRVYPDRHHVVVGLTTTFHAPVERPGDVLVRLLVEHLGRSSLALGFTVCDPSNGTVFAEGVRTAVHIDRDTRRSTPWSNLFRQRLEETLR